MAREGMRISDLISSRDKLNLNADLDVGLLVREITNTSDIEVMVFDLRKVFYRMPLWRNQSCVTVSRSYYCFI